MQKSTIILTCQNNHEQKLHLDGDPEFAENLAKIMDGSHPIFISAPTAPSRESRILGFTPSGFCGICEAPVVARVVHAANG